jgi:hypothetical protein
MASVQTSVVPAGITTFQRAGMRTGVPLPSRLGCRVSQTIGDISSEHATPARLHEAMLAKA